MALERFFWQIDANEIDRLERESRELLDRLQTTEVGGAIADKKRRSIEDLLATVNARRANIAKARENYEFVSIELQRIEAKLSGIAELAVNRQNPDMLSHDVDEVARSVEATEEAIGELHSLTGLALSDDIMTPEILMPSLSNSRAR
jgi:multidrug resistance efflux pump